jgi:HPt (histidine-containing phosphotransfer) domain-containing protein
MDGGDLLEAAKVAHTLKGMLANLSMEQGASLAATIEAAARAGDMPRIKERLVAFDSEMVDLSAAVAVFLAGR